MDKEVVRLWMHAHLGQHLPKGTKTFFTQFVDNNPGKNFLGARVDVATFEEKVIHVAETFTVVKVGRNKFSIVDAALLRTSLELESTVRIKPYQRRYFNGRTFLEGTETETRDGIKFTSYVLGESISKIPLPEPTNQYLVNMLDLLHNGDCPDGRRKISNMLVDFKARNLAWHDPEVDSSTSDPQFRFDCETGKFAGHVRIGLDVFHDTYYVELYRLGATEHALETSCRMVHFDELAAILEDLLCDGDWKFCQVEVLKSAPKAASSAKQLAFAASGTHAAG